MLRVGEDEGLGKVRVMMKGCGRVKVGKMGQG